MNVTAQAGDTLIQASGTPSLATPEAKRVLRATLRARRKAHSPQHARQAARAVARKTRQCAALCCARRVGVYLAMGSELPTAALITALTARGLLLYAPAIVRGHLRFRPLRGQRLARHALGMAQPRTGPAVRVNALDVLLLPLLGFDARGTRLGQGGGYYDRALSRAPFRPYRLGLAYAAQQVAELPRDGWDQPLHAVLTERGLIRFARSVSRNPTPCATG